MTLNNKGSCFMDMHKPGDALDYLQRSLKIKEKALLDIGSDVNVAMKQKNIGMCFMMLNQPADALDFIHRSLEVYEKISLDIGSVMRV